MREAPPLPTHHLAGAFNFVVTLLKSGGSGGGQSTERLGDGGFQECSGLEIEMDVEEHLEGGRNDGVVRLVGRGKYTNIVLKRGMLHSLDGPVNADLWQWLQGVLAGVRPVPRYDGIIHVLDNRGVRNDESYRVLATWTFERGLPARVRGPDLNARTGEIALEELHIAHEGLRLVSP